MTEDVKGALQAIIGRVANLQLAGGLGRVFELYVMTGIGLALKGKGYDVWIRRSDGTRVRPTDQDRTFIQRSGRPTGVTPRAHGAHHASSIVFSFGNRMTWELLNGIQFKGRSSALHEIDVAVVPESVAHTLRNAPSVEYPFGRPRISIECKDVGTNGSIDEMRAFVARLYDLTILRSHHKYLGFSDPPRVIYPGAPPDQAHHPARTYRDENIRTMNVLVRRTGFAKGTAPLAAHYAIVPHESITPGSASSTQLMRDIASWIHQNCR